MERSIARNKPLKKGFTTGSCAAAASKAAAIMLFTGEEPGEVSIETPAGAVFTAKIYYVNLENGREASCAVLKDGGDDPDITTGLYIYSKVVVVEEEVEGENGVMSTWNPEKRGRNFMSTSDRIGNDTRDTGVMSTDLDQPLENIENPEKSIMSTSSDSADLSPAPHSAFKLPLIEIDGGEGVGRVTKPGLDRDVGEAAINSVPRAMIEEAVRSEAIKAGFKGRIRVIISVPGGEKIAQKTFNPRLGIEGGISILGTSGVEEPMSTRAVIDTIEVEMRVHRAAGESIIAVTPGNYGQAYMLKAYGYDLDRSVQCSNYIGDAIELADKLGFEAMLLTGHIGKLIKLAGGITNTHSSNGDCRMELLCAAALRAGCSVEACKRVLDCISTEEALRNIEEEGLLDKTMELVLEGVMRTLALKAGESLRTECIIYSNDFGALAQSDGAAALIKRIGGGD